MPSDYEAGPACRLSAIEYAQSRCWNTNGLTLPPIMTHMAEPLTTPSGIMIVYIEEETEEGGKGIFGSVRRRVEKMAALNVEGLRTNLQDFCLQIGSMMSHLSSAVS